MKVHAAKFLRNTIISAVVLLLLIVGAGVAYTWYTGQQASDNPAAIAAPVEAPPAPTIKPSKPAPDAKVSASVQLITSPVTPGSNASITVKTNAGAKCTIKVEYNKIPSTDSGLIAKTADEFGMVSWTWTVEPTVPYGKWPVTVTCANTKNSAMVKGDLQVAKSVTP